MDINNSIVKLCDYIKGNGYLSTLNTEDVNYLKKLFGTNLESCDCEYNDFGVLYRGLFFKKTEDLELFLKNIDNKGYVNLSLASWSESTGTAMNFMFGAGYYFYNYTCEEEFNNGFSLKISSEVELESIIVSYLEFSQWASLQSNDFSDIINLMSGDSEYVVKAGLFQIEIDHATENAREHIDRVLSKKHPSCKFTEYI